ncbi:MAG: hypothetical protein M3365_02850 [Gemmatimonadota bacterium]|nr:hypothetical protein [Gemmatimonadota bacterium]
MPPKPAVDAIELQPGDVRYLTPAEKATFAVGSGEYALVVFHGSPTGASNLQVEAVADSTVPASGPPDPAILQASRIAFSSPADDRPVEYDRSFERELRIQERRIFEELAPSARAAQARQRAARFSVGAAALEVGQRLILNASTTACTNRSDRVGFVRAISERAVIVADSANPEGGFTDEDYQALAIAFDTLVYPVNVENFGAPADLDQNGRSLIFFTRAVNELTDEGDSSVVGGFFFGRDLFPAMTTGELSGCAGSNQAELFYLLVPDPAGVVNNNKRSKEGVARGTIGVLAHEFQHLINASRRLFVNNAREFEVVWLNEGLSHIAEELLFYRTSGLAPRQNIDLERLRSSPRILEAVNAYQIANFVRLRKHLEDPERNSPYQLDDDLATRGSAWALLRYAADQKASAQQPIWFALVNNVEVGLANFTKVFGEGVPRVRDWTVSVYTDDVLPGVPQPFRQPSWNYRSIYPAIASGYPLKTRQLTGSTPTPVTLAGGGAAYFRFGVAGNAAVVRLTSQGGSVPAIVEAALVRTK